MLLSCFSQHHDWIAICVLRNLKRGYKDVATLLLDHGADVDKADNYGWSPLFAAALVSACQSRFSCLFACDAHSQLCACA